MRILSAFFIFLPAISVRASTAASRTLSSEPDWLARPTRGSSMTRKSSLTMSDMSIQLTHLPMSLSSISTIWSFWVW